MTRNLPRRPASARTVVAARTGPDQQAAPAADPRAVLVGVTVLVLQIVNLQVVRAAALRPTL